MTDFFVSYNRHDRAWAEWIAWTLEEAGYSTVLQAWDFGAGGNFVLEMQKAASGAKRTIAVLSDTYLKSEFTAPEWAAAFAQDPTGKHRTLIPVRVKECQLTGLLAPIVYVDLVEVAEADARDRLLRSLIQDRAKPTQAPRFPGSGAASGDRPKPAFPPTAPVPLPAVRNTSIYQDEPLAMPHDRLRQLEKNLALLQEQLGGKEEALIRAPEEEKIRIKQQIQALREQMHPFEEEYWQLVADAADGLPIAEPEAEVAIAEIVGQVNQLQARQPAPYPEDVLRLLQEIRDRLDQPGTPAAAKLKGILSSFPPFVGVTYEAEIDTESFLRRHFPTFTRLIRSAAKK